MLLVEVNLYMRLYSKNSLVRCELQEKQDAHSQIRVLSIEHGGGLFNPLLQRSQFGRTGCLLRCK